MLCSPLCIETVQTIIAFTTLWQQIIKHGFMIKSLAIMWLIKLKSLHNGSILRRNNVNMVTATKMWTCLWHLFMNYDNMWCINTAKNVLMGIMLSLLWYKYKGQIFNKKSLNLLCGKCLSFCIRPVEGESRCKISGSLKPELKN